MSAPATRVMLAMALLLGACPGKGGQGGGTAGSGAGPATGATCDDVRTKVEQLYRAEAQVKEPKRVEEAVADNTTMTMNDCARDSAAVVACIQRVTTVAELESRCLAPLDDEGSEGDALRR